MVWAADIPDVDTYRGLAGVESSARLWFSALVLTTVYGRGKDSNIETEGKYAQLWTMRHGKATRFAGYTDWTKALEAVGLSK